MSRRVENAVAKDGSPFAHPSFLFASLPQGRAISLFGAFLLTALLSYRLGELPLLEPDEGRNGEVAREMALTDDYVLPHLNGVPYLDKPVLYFAAAAAMIELLGPTELAVRLPALLFTLATLLLIWSFARRHLGRPGAWAALVATASAPFTVAYARTVIFDSALTFFVCAALFSFYTAIERYRAGGQFRRWTVLGWAAIALGVLTKGPVGLVLPLMVCAPFAVWRGASRAVWRVSGIAVAGVIVIPWVLAVERRVPDFLHYAVVTESFERLASDKLRRTEPIWYFIPCLVIGALPWSLALLVRAREVIRQFRARNPIVVFLVLWIVIPFVFFSLSKSKRPQYILPLIPALGLLVGFLWNESSHDVRRLLRLFAIATVAAGLVFISAAFALPLFRRMEPAIASNASDAAIVGVVAMVVAWAAWGMRNRPELAILALALPTLTLPITLHPALKQLAADRSTRDLAVIINREVTPKAPIILVKAYSPSLSFYLQRPVLIATADAQELTSNYVRFHSRQWIDAPGSPLRSLTWFAGAKDSLSPESVVVTKTRFANDWRLAEGRFRPIWSSDSLVAFGPARRSSSSTPGR